MEKVGEITLQMLQQGCGTGLCPQLMAQLDDIHIHMLFSSLTYERMQRKGFEITKILDEMGSSWAQATYATLLRYLLGRANRKASERLASTITHNILMRENATLWGVEALLLGGAGLLDLYEDEFVVRLKREFEHLAAKYNIIPLKAEEWRLSGIHINNHPALRLAQLAACIHKNIISISNFNKCKDEKDVWRLFSCEASDYWVEAITRGSSERGISSKIGYMMSHILAINVIAPLILAYSNYVDSATLNEKSLDLLYSLPAEDNVYTRHWQSVKPMARCAFDSQALIQLSTEYCARRLCKTCPLAKHFVKSDAARIAK